MGYLLPALTDAKFSNQREVVLNERRQNYENRPYGLAGMAIVSALYPPDHPYHWLTIGGGRRHPRRAHRRRARVLSALLPSRRTPRWRSPATSMPRPASRSRSDYFARDSRRREARRACSVTTPASPPAGRQAGARGSRRAAAAVHGVALAGALRRRRRRAGSRRPRCCRAARRRACIARSSTSSASRPKSRRRRIRASSAASSRSSPPPRRAARSRKSSARSRRSSAGFLDRGPTPGELERCLAQAEAHFLFRLQTVGGFGGKSDQLNAYNMFLGDPGYFDEAISSATAPPRPTRLQRGGRAVAQAHQPRRPERRAARARRRWRCPDRSRWRSPDGGRSEPPAGSRARAPVHVSRQFGARRSPNGLRVWTVEHRQVPLVSRARAGARSGAAADPAERPGLAAITGDMLDEGCGDQSALDVHEALGRIGAQLDIEVGHDATVLGLTTLERYLGPRPRADARHAHPPAVRAARVRSRPRSAAEPAAAAEGHAAGAGRSRVHAAAVSQPSLRAPADRHRKGRCGR